MTTLNINGYRVRLGNRFASMSLAKQKHVVAWIVSHISPDDHPSAKNIARSPVQWSVVQ